MSRFVSLSVILALLALPLGACSKRVGQGAAIGAAGGAALGAVGSGSIIGNAARGAAAGAAGGFIYDTLFD